MMSNSNPRLTAELVLQKSKCADAPPCIPLYKDDVVIGRRHNCDIVLDSLQISRRHATLQYLTGKWYVRDDSSNGLSIGSEPMEQLILKELKQNDLLHLIPMEGLVYRFGYKREARETVIIPVPVPSPPIITLADGTDDEEGEEEDKFIKIQDNTPISESPLCDSENEYHIVSESEDELEILTPPTQPKSSTSSLEVSNLRLGMDKRKIENEADEDEKVFQKRKHHSFGYIEYLNQRFVKPSGSSKEEESDGNNLPTLSACNNNPINLINPTSLRTTSNTECSNGNIVTMTPLEVKFCHEMHTLQNQCMKLEQKYQFAEAQIETLKMEKRQEMEEYSNKLHEAQSEIERLKMDKWMEQRVYSKMLREAQSPIKNIKEEIHTQIMGTLEEEFSCCICNEVFIQATVTECGHTFCAYCIKEWTRKKPQCPICQKRIRNFRNPKKNIEINNFILRIHTIMSEEIQTARNITINERKTQEQSGRK